MPPFLAALLSNFAAAALLGAAPPLRAPGPPVRLYPGDKPRMPGYWRPDQAIDRARRTSRELQASQPVTLPQLAKPRPIVARLARRAP